ncbi:MAG: aldo/keto reductase [Burkholderiales bacterium]|nr:aldo/keto reductase [Burkholderiales bacterium]MDE2158949.1 aldo/keto reductase [Burkholderiales bacterium]
MKPPLTRHLPEASRLALGCMGLGGPAEASPIAENHVAQAQAALEAAREIGITLFDHADIYRRGNAERVFGELFRRQPSLRDGMVLQTKCGIRFADDAGPGRYDFSRAYILAAVDASLARLQTDRIDILLLHRPDPLMEPDEVAEAFSRLRASGKVRHFGVSNMRAGALRWLQQALDAPLVANQIEMSLLARSWLDQDTCFNDAQGAGGLGWSDTLQHCMAAGIQLQAWGPLAQGWLSGALPGDAGAAVRDTAALVAEMAQRHAVPRESIVLAWLLRHPARIQPVIGTTQAERIRACAAATRVALSREEWYALYVSARGRRLP